MIHEYGVEPELAATWGHPMEFRYFVQQFGPGKPKLISRYPREWKRRVWAALGPATEMEKKRLEELLARASETMVRRVGPFDDSRPWLENALADHARAPFRAILARAALNGTSPILAPEQLHGAASWDCPTGVVCKRTSSDMSQAVTAMLRNCRTVAFVDPYFGPENPRHRRPLSAFLRAMLDRRPGEPPAEILVLTSAKPERGTREFFEAECASRLPRAIPKGLRVSLRRLTERLGGEALHNRYILTDVGGVTFGAGLDDADPGENDDIAVLDGAQLALRQSQYLSPTPSFDLEGADVVVAGTGKLDTLGASGA